MAFSLRLGAVLLALGLIVRGIAVSSAGLALFDLICCFGAVAVAGWAWKLGRRTVAVGLTAAVCGLYLLACWQIVNWIFCKPPNPANLAAIRQELEAEPPDLIQIDMSALRYLYDYRLPPNARDSVFTDFDYAQWQQLTPEQRHGQKRVWVVNAVSLTYYDAYKNDPRIEPVRLFGVKIPHCVRNGAELFLLK